MKGYLPRTRGFRCGESPYVSAPLFYRDFSEFVKLRSLKDQF